MHVLCRLRYDTCPCCSFVDQGANAACCFLGFTEKRTLIRIVLWWDSASWLIVSEPDYSLHIFDIHLLKLLLEKVDLGWINAATLKIGWFNDGTGILVLILGQVINVRRANWSIYNNQLFKILLAVWSGHKLNIGYVCWRNTSVQVVLQSHHLLLVWRQESNALVVWSSCSLDPQASGWQYLVNIKVLAVFIGNKQKSPWWREFEKADRLKERWLNDSKKLVSVHVSDYYLKFVLFGQLWIVGGYLDVIQRLDLMFLKRIWLV